MEMIPVRHSLNATVRVPGSKSLTNRALLVAALADGTTRLVNALISDDTRYFARALEALGFDLSVEAENARITVTGLGGQIPAKQAELYIGNAGTAARFLSAFLTLGEGEFILDGDARMRERPLGDLVEALAQLGAIVTPAGVRAQPSSPLSPREPHGGAHLHRSRSGPRAKRGETANRSAMQVSRMVRVISPPVKIVASGLPGGRTQIAGDISSQFLSALLMVAPYAQTPVEIEVSTELNSKPYVDMTLSLMADFGITVERDGYQCFKIPLTPYKPQATYPIESDASAASYFFAAPALCGGTVQVEAISRRSVQGDIAFLDILEKMGCAVEEMGDSILVKGSSPLHGLDIDMCDIPDTAQTLAAVAPFASTPTRIRGIASARVKETDRVHATCVELARLGVRVDEHEDGLTIYPCDNIRPATVRTYNDHRMAMAFSLIGLRVPGISIENPNCVSKTFPNFFEMLGELSKHATVEKD